MPLSIFHLNRIVMLMIKINIKQFLISHVKNKSRWLFHLKQDMNKISILFYFFGGGGEGARGSIYRYVYKYIDAVEMWNHLYKFQCWYM